MLNITRFLGINNVLPKTHLKDGELQAATDVDLGLGGEISRRDGYTEVVAECYKNLWQGAGFLLATRNGDLISRFPDGTVHELVLTVGTARAWYVNLPDGRTAFMNGAVGYLTDGLTATPWGVPVPASFGSLTDIAGNLFVGDYQWALTYTRQADGLEGGPIAAPPQAVSQGGIVLTGLPVLADYDINVYLSSHNSGGFYLAGEASGGVFSFTGHNHELAVPLRTDDLQPPPAGTVLAFWRGRALLAQGAVLWASRTNQWELFDYRRDFKQFADPITLIQPVDDGIYVGTERELVFLAGTEWDKLAYRQAVDGAVVLGSGAPIRGELLKLGRDVGQGSAMLCIAAGNIVAGFNGGEVSRMTEGRYHTDATEVWATVRDVRGIPQYVALPQ